MQTEQRLRKAISDVSCEIDKKYEILDPFTTSDEVNQAECECCGLKEECTQDYISAVKFSHSGNWVCGLCSEAVKELTLERSSRLNMQEAVSCHKGFCQEFNNTTRLNPKLSLTYAMRGIAKRSCEKRNSKTPKLARSTSCVPRIDLKQ
ncbi:uncharacterized protein LOC8275670 [Ricinus communis]|uniref:DUF1677 domain-containing protein n=1 Tax=Ricinus communis TaxID=3988 RepID=B9RRZ8_RICCO|nr:uncharacterized protein LOC8275670 [Ricinus communis]EEF45858.1 conserved hypothetical protein [Ricinus communis]|eukprot:XP_002516517.1 uncharacterized protein LOC8275670 [Ricinus communis]